MTMEPTTITKIIVINDKQQKKYLLMTNNKNYHFHGEKV